MQYIKGYLLIGLIGFVLLFTSAPAFSQFFGRTNNKEKSDTKKVDSKVEKASASNKLATPEKVKTIRSGAHAATAEIYLSEKEDLIYVGLHSYQSLWFRIPVSVRKPISGEFKLYFAFSTILIPETSNITLSVNDIPLKSITLKDRDPEISEEIFTIPAGFLKEGLNHLRIQLYAQASTDECKDIDNPANWYVIKRSSVLNLFYNDTPSQNLAHFPEPLLRMESFSKNGMTFIVPKKASTTLIETQANTAKQLGALSQETSDDVPIYGHSEVLPKEKNILKSNLIVINKQSDLPFGLTKELPLGQDLAQYALDLSPWSESAVIFSVSSDEVRHLKPAVNVMISDILRRKLKGKEKSLDPYYGPYSRRSLADIFSLRRTFENLGYDDQMIRGSFYNESAYYFAIPASWRLKKNAAINFVMDLSPLLVNNQSEMSVFVNGLFADSVKLIADRNDSKIVRIELPSEVLLDKGFEINVRFYLDIGQKGCERRFPEKAWVLMHKESYVSLPHVDKTGLTLKDFPAPYMLNNKVSLPLIIIPDEPDNNALGALFRFAFTLGQYLPQSQKWLIVKRSSEVTDDDLQKNLVVLGRAETNSFFSRINPDLPISFDLEDSTPFITRTSAQDDEEAKLDGNYQWNLPADFRGEIGCVELITNPWNKEKSIVVITGSAEYLLSDAVNLIRNRAKMALINTKIAIISSEGSVIPYTDKALDQETIDLKRDALRARVPMFLIIVVTLIFAIVISIYFMQKNKR